MQAGNVQVKTLPGTSSVAAWLSSWPACSACSARRSCMRMMSILVLLSCSICWAVNSSFRSCRETCKVIRRLGNSNLTTDPAVHAMKALGKTAFVHAYKDILPLSWGQCGSIESPLCDLNHALPLLWASTPSSSKSGPPLD